MKVLVASDCHTFQTGGISHVVATLINGLISRGHEVKVLALSDRNQSYKDGYNYYIRSFPAFYYPEQRLSSARHDPLLTELTEWNPDIIHLHTEGSIARMTWDIAKKTNTPVVMTAHTDYAQFIFGRFFKSPPVKLIARIWGNMTYKNTAAVVLPSEKARSFGQFVAVKNPIRVIPNGINPEKYNTPVTPEEKAAFFKKYMLKDNGHTLVMVTRVSREKNIKEILLYLPSLLKELPDAQLVIAGEGPDRKNLQDYCRHTGLAKQVRFLGRIPPDQVYKIYAMGNVFVSASTFEVHSISYLEALVCGLPLVCRDDASLLGVLNDGEDGFIYHTEKEFTDSVVRVLTDKELHQSMHEKALSTANEFSNERFIDRSVALYEDILKS